VNIIAEQEDAFLKIINGCLQKRGVLISPKSGEDASKKVLISFGLNKSRRPTEK